MPSQTRRQYIKYTAAGVGSSLVAGCSGLTGSGATQVGISTAAQGASHYTMSAPIPDILNEHSSDPELQATVRTSEGSVANMRSLGQGTTEIGTAVAPVAFEAYNGTGVFDSQIDLKLLMQGELPPQYHVVRADSGIESVSDLEGKTVTAGPAGSGLQGPHKTMMELLDINVEYEYLGYAEGGRALRNGDVDAWWIFHGNPPQNAFATAGEDLRVLSFTDAELETIKSEFPFITEYEMAQDMLPGMSSARTTWASGSFWCATSDTLSADVAEEFVRVVSEHPEPIREANVNSREFGVEFAYADIGVPYHEGAQTYFQDAGVL